MTISTVWRGSMALLVTLHGCAAQRSAVVPAATQEPATASKSTKPEKEPGLVMGFMKPGETLELPAQPSWQGIDCLYPHGWEGPAAGGVALFKVATEAELRAAYPTHRSPGESRPWPQLPPDELRAAFLLGAAMAQLHIEGIDGDEVARLPGVGDVNDRLVTVLAGPDGDDVQEVPPQTVSMLATLRDWRPIGREWAARLLEHARHPPPLTPEREAMLGKLREKFGTTEMPERDTDMLADWYREDAWIAVACQFVQLARYAVQNQRRIFLLRYVD